MDRYSTLMLNYLPTASDLEWMYFATHSNYDCNKLVISWMVNQSDCPDSVALAIYWMMDPVFFSEYASPDEVPGWASEDYKIVKTIELKFLGGDYRRASFGFDPENDSIASENWVESQGATPETAIPAEMLRALPGPLLTPDDFPQRDAEGLPPHIFAAIWNEEEE